MSVSKLLLAKLELSYGTDPTPDNSSAIETMDLEQERYAGDRVERSVDHHTLGGKEQTNVLPHTNTSFNVPFAGSGVAGTPPLWGEIMRACGFDETVNAAVDVVYQLAANADDLSNCDSVAFYDYRSQANMVQHSLGCRGKNMIEMGEGELPRIAFSDFIGSYLTPSDEAEPTGIDWSGWLSELPFTRDNLPVLTLDAISACTSAFTIDFGQEVSRRNLPNCESTVISNYNVVGTMSIVAPDVAVTNWWEKSQSHQGITLYPFALQLGTVAGNILKIDCAEVQVVSMTEEESNQGDLQYSMELAFIGPVTITAM